MVTASCKNYLILIKVRITAVNMAMSDSYDLKLLNIGILLCI